MLYNKLILNLNVKQTLSDVHFWIILLLFVRLIGITNPPLEVAHNWRQTTVTMVARNFLEIDNNILYPRIDIAGKKTGITGMEFPIFNYLIYLMAKLFGYAHWYGRLINLFFSSFGLWFFHKVIRKYFKPEIAFNATIILLFSLWFSFSRKIMPDTFSMSFIIAGIYFGSNYLENKGKLKKQLNLLLYGLLVCLGTLSKLPSAYLLIVFIIPFLAKKITLQRKIYFSTFSILALIPVVIWYFYWFPHLVSTYDFWHFSMGSSFFDGSSEIMNNLPLTLKLFYSNALKYIGFIAFLIGLIYSILKKKKLLLTIFGLSFFTYLIIVLKAGHIFYENNYYIIPFVPIMSLSAGFGLTQLKNKKIALLFIIAIAAEGVLNQQHDFRIKKDALALLNLEKDLATIAQPNDLIAINSEGQPTAVYFSHHKGWTKSNNNLQDKAQIRSLQEKGLKFIIVLKKVFGTDVLLNHPIALENENYRIYKLN